MRRQTGLNAHTLRKTGGDTNAGAVDFKDEWVAPLNHLHQASRTDSHGHQTFAVIIATANLAHPTTVMWLQLSKTDLDGFVVHTDLLVVHIKHPLCASTSKREFSLMKLPVAERFALQVKGSCAF